MEAKKNGPTAAQVSRRFVLSVYDWLGTLVTALIILSLLVAYVFRVVGVEGDSMLPTLKDGDMLLLSSDTDNLKRGDIIVVDRYTQDPLIKRVIAVGGETVSISEDGTVAVNGKILEEAYIQGKTDLKDFVGETVVPRDCVFVMGDNRVVSKDSRTDEIGMISEKDVVGKAVFCVWPLSSFGAV